MAWLGAQPVKEGDTRPRCTVKVRRSRRFVACGRLAQLCEIRADRFHFRIEMCTCKGHRTLLGKWKPDIRVRELDYHGQESEVA
jgi:hypothetical protein